MTTVSVPLSKTHERKLKALVKQGVGRSPASVMHKALDKLAEDEAIEVVLHAEREATIPLESLKEYAHPKRILASYRKAIKKYPSRRS